jgi:hypothetical protein
MRLITFVSVIAAVTLLVGSAAAHHNMSALFDFNDRVTVSGTLTRLDWRNPHIYVFVDGKTESGQAATQAWSIEGPPPSFFRAREINRTDIEAAIGKAVTAEVSRARDGTTAGLLRVMTLPDGKVVSACPQNC